MSATLGVYRGRRNVSFVCYCYGHNRHLHVLTHSLPTRRSSDLEVQGSGDVKYHLGTSSDRDFDGNVVHLSLTANPSHLECVNPVVIGTVRAKQMQLGDPEREMVLPLLIPGDAAFAGQGVAGETLMLRSDGRRVGKEVVNPGRSRWS